MPLTRANVTIASRRMLPTYPVIALWIGLVYVFDPGGRLEGSPAFPLLPTAVWGAGFVLAGSVLVLAIATRKRDLYTEALAPLMLWFIVWAAALAYSAAFDGTSFSAPALPVLAARACWSSMLSLLAKET